MNRPEYKESRPQEGGFIFFGFSPGCLALRDGFCYTEDSGRRRAAPSYIFDKSDPIPDQKES